MSSITITETNRFSFPQHNATVKVQVLSAGHFTLPEYQFVSPVSDTARKTVPSFSFLIQHVNTATGKKTSILFDLGLRRNLERYSEPIQRHVTTRQPMTTDPDVTKSLAVGGLKPDDIDYVIYSHVHWDHIGEPLDFPRSTFVVGHGAVDLLHGSSKSLRGGHSFFEADLLDPARTVELSDPASNWKEKPDHKSPGEVNFNNSWTSLQDLPAVLDVFQDQSLYIVNAPGHLQGHINLLAKTGANEWVYMAGDSCHDRRILRQEKEIGEWNDTEGHVCCIHANRAKAEETIDRIRKLEQRGVEVIFAHDIEWEQDQNNRSRLWGA